MDEAEKQTMKLSSSEIHLFYTLGGLSTKQLITQHNHKPNSLTNSRQKTKFLPKIQ